MNKEDIIRMAREAGIPASEVVIKGNGTYLRVVDVERFAALVEAQARAEEREACAQVCDAEATIEGIAQRCAAAIRARGEK